MQAFNKVVTKLYTQVKTTYFTLDKFYKCLKPLEFKFIYLHDQLNHFVYIQSYITLYLTIHNQAGANRDFADYTNVAITTASALISSTSSEIIPRVDSVIIYTLHVAISLTSLVKKHTI